MFKNRWLEPCARWCLGIVFVYASIHKIIEPGAFAKIIYGYMLFPAEIINLMAIVIPFIELFCGILLLSGFMPRSSAIIINFLLFAFMTAISINLIRGHEFDCGCFSIHEQGAVSSAVMLLIRDSAWFLAGLIVISHRGERRFALRSDFFGSHHP